MDEPVPSETGADLPIIEPTAPLEIDIATLPRARHAQGRNAYGPGGLHL